MISEKVDLLLTVAKRPFSDSLHKPSLDASSGRSYLGRLLAKR